jgi:hypothetical protein
MQACKKSVAEAMQRAATALRRQQSIEGLWEDYALPVGASNEWVTALVALCLAEASKALTLDDAQPAAAAAHTGLLRGRTRQAGFGFNAGVAADADSTATCLLLSLALDQVPEQADSVFLLEHVRADGGIATFHGPAGWGLSHPCVTPVAAQALAGCGHPLSADVLAGYAARTRSGDGFWPAYWWSGPFYATAAWLRLNDACGLRFAPPEQPVEHEIKSAMDLALAVEIAARWRTGGLSQLTSGLLAHQGREGLWPPSRTLRVTDIAVVDSEYATGELYADVRGLLSTAMALRALASVLPRL